MSAHFLQPCLAHPEAQWTLHDDTTGHVVASSIIRAFDRKSRNEGLLGRQGLAPRTAILLAPCSGVHTWFMRFPIDILFLDRRGRVLAVRRSVRPWRLAVRLGAFAVAELGAGEAGAIEPGHALSLHATVAATPSTAREPVWRRAASGQ